VYDAPMTEVIAADQMMTPNTIFPVSPSACSKADAAGLRASSFAPPATTPRTARNSSTRMTPVIATPMIELRVISGTKRSPLIPLSTSRCAPAYTM
jgi:hypothetical protein